MEPIQWDNRFSTFCSDLFVGVITTEEVDPDIFDATRDIETRVSIEAFMEEGCDADDGIKMVGSFDNDNDRTEMVRVRNTVYVRPP